MNREVTTSRIHVVGCADSGGGLLPPLDTLSKRRRQDQRAPDKLSAIAVGELGCRKRWQGEYWFSIKPVLTEAVRIN